MKNVKPKMPIEIASLSFDTVDTNNSEEINLRQFQSLVYTYYHVI